MVITDNVPPFPVWLSADLEDAIKTCRQGCNSRQAQQPSAIDVGSNYTWLITQGEWAARKLKQFSQPAELLPELQENVSIVLFPLTASASIASEGIKEPKTLTEACLWLKKFQQNSCARLIMRGPLNGIKAEDVYEAALIAFLFLAKKYFVFGLHDLYQLVASITGREDEDENCDGLGISNPGFIQCPPSETCSVLSIEDIGLWNSVSSQFEPLIPLESSTKVLKFPSPFPQLATEFFFMERYRPHGAHPVSKSVFSVWGNWTSADQSWACIVASRDRLMTQAYQQRLKKEFTQGSIATRCKLVSHWVEGLHYLYHLGLNNYHLIVREGVRHLHKIKYEIAAKPNVGATYICLAYMNHLEYHRRLLVSIGENLEEFPNAWRVSQKPPWAEKIDQSCQTLVADTKVAEDRARDIRQRSIFGMNTQEINGSAWPIKYFAISAVPLTVVLVLLPLVALPLLDVLIRINSAVKTRRWLTWFLLPTVFALNLSIDIFIWLGYDKFGSSLAFAGVIIGGIAVGLTGAYLYFPVMRAFDIRRRQDRWDFLAFSIGVFAYYLFSLLGPVTGLELIPIGLYGVFRLSYRAYLQKKGEKRSNVSP
ncbi:hypothetical protein O1611_g5774 [Lasiodiplodia mahajangana]|uniref:Uncharacterized protein n=1 Tax=Lasiodiplodia mahajangana TaxID=1108764 RepID=A0ACC2JKH7_9PEZI|nr:hypothetical protein O1611_g5774 [Lasiodiplodia mahajangana]